MLTFSPEGNPIGWVDLASNGLKFAEVISIAGSGEILAGHDNQLALFSSSLSTINRTAIPGQNVFLDGAFPADSGGFWILYTVDVNNNDHHTIQFYLAHYYIDGSMSLPQLIYDENTGQGSRALFVTSSGIPRPHIEDSSGYSYQFSTDDEGDHLSKYDALGQLVYSNDFASDPDWAAFDLNSMQSHHFVTWSGDFYTLRATADGVEFSKYTLFVNHPPICLLSIVTPMPYTGPAPALITFDASQSYDPDPGDTITYHWDFDGDGIFDEPGDSYTGPPNHPTHSYTQSYTGPVMLKVIDSHGAESVCTVTVVVIIT